MTWRPRPRTRLLAAALATLLALVLPAAADGLTVTVTDAPTSRAIPAGFVSPSFELTALLSYAGRDPASLDPVFEQLVRNLAPVGPVLRIGGDSTDWSWYPVAGMRPPPWARYALTPAWMAVARQLASALKARLILGINLEADSDWIARAEADAMLAGIGRRSIAALELGNEPELYGSFNWYRTAHGVGVRGRGPGYDFSAFSGQFARIAGGLPDVPLAGPSIGSPRWSQSLGSFLAANRRVSVVTLHRYPLQRCVATTHVSAAQLLSASASDGLAAGVAPYVKLARDADRQLRIDELNSVSCGGEAGLSNTFASSLWALDTMFALARAGVSGVNVHTTPGAVNQLFSVRQEGAVWSARVYPIYYGLLAFAEAAPAGSRILRLAGAPSGATRMWADRSPDGRRHLVVIDTAPHSGARVDVRVPGAVGNAVLERLQAASLGATGGVTLDGQGFGAATGTGALAGAARPTALAPHAGSYAISVPAGSAAIVTFGR